MLSDLPESGSVSLVLAVVITMTFSMVAVLMKLLGAVGAFEFMAFAGGTTESDGDEQQGKAFHCGGI